MNAEAQLIALVREITALRGLEDEESNARRQAVRELLKAMGRTAAFFGGFDAMKRLHDACEALTGNTNEIGAVLNWAWDGIAGWWA